MFGPHETDFASSIMFGESHLEVLYRTDAIIRNPGPEVPFRAVFPSKAVNFIHLCVYGLTGGW